MSERAPRRSRWVERLQRRSDAGRWERAAEQVAGLPRAELSARREEARRLHLSLESFLHCAEARLASGTQEAAWEARLPATADWSWRPALWRAPLARVGGSGLPSPSALCEEITLFHDCPRREIVARQVRNSEGRGAPFGLSVEVFAFEGSFLSLALELPVAAVEGLRRRHLLRLDVLAETERPLDLYARLNLRHGPNTEQLLRGLDVATGEVSVEFDLAQTDLNESRVEKAWIDLILDEPAMNAVTLRDLTFCRHPRAEV